MIKIVVFVLGILILITGVFVNQIILTPTEKSDIKRINSLCTTEVEISGITLPLGSWGQKLTGTEEKCKQTYYLTLVVNYGWVIYVIGGLFMTLGLVIKTPRKVIK